jgi:hypothetical protein
MEGRAPRLRESFAFPLSTPQARRDILVGGTLLLGGVVGWVFNLGHRLEVVRRLYHDDPPYFRGFSPWGATFVRGLTAACAIFLYLSPAAALAVVAVAAHALALLAPAAVAFVLAIYSLPGGMTYNAAFGDISYLYRPDKAFRRAVAGGAAYLHAWLIAAAAIAASLLGLLALGVGFLYASVWAWSVVGHAFSMALVWSQRGAGVSADSAGRGGGGVAVPHAAGADERVVRGAGGADRAGRGGP